ncbi:MAG: DUF1491 family protein [Alphaproteobacteria bacterium]|nr:DUF1491 family protein [Alphaproteobacteria bacterium]MDH5556064.1 DUF1491 family protein [Alphaproteobacteria bacterium]
MDDSRIPTELWVKAHLRRLSAQGVPAVVARRGDPHGGMVILKVNRLDLGCRVLTQTRDLDGVLSWMPALKGELVPEAEADDYIARQTARDRDLWVVEVETRAGEHGFEGREL